MNDELIVANNEMTEKVTNKLLTLKDIVTAIQSDENDIYLVDNIHRFKLMMVKNSLVDIMNMIDMARLVKNSLIEKVKSDVDIYPITTQLDILNSMNKLIDRDLAIMESILPKADSISDFLEKTTKQVTIVNQVNVDKFTPSQVDKISQIVESVISQLNSISEDSSNG